MIESIPTFFDDLCVATIRKKEEHSKNHARKREFWISNMQTCKKFLGLIQVLFAIPKMKTAICSSDIGSGIGLEAAGSCWVIGSGITRSVQVTKISSILVLVLDVDNRHIYDESDAV